MRTVHVTASKEYDVRIGPGLLGQAGTLVAQSIPPCQTAVITDDHVAPLYLQKTERALRASGFSVCSLTLPHGEGSKSIATLERILDFLSVHHLTKSDVVLALGGGVIGDVTGFAASAYLRGVPYIQLPTTLLAAVDSSVGGKTAVNLASGKNLAGAFYQPSLVLCDTDTLRSLPTETYADGVSESIKHGVIGSAALFAALRPGLKEQAVEDVIAACVTMKADFVAQDEFDTGRRQILNFGHTIGHAIEKCSGFTLTHGHAVAIGMVYIARAAWRRGLSRENCTPELLEALQNNDLPVTCSYTGEELAEAALADKKRRGDTITLILPEKIGHCYRYPLPITELTEFVRDGAQ